MHNPTLSDIATVLAMASIMKYVPSIAKYLPLSVGAEIHRCTDAVHTKP